MNTRDLPTASEQLALPLGRIAHDEEAPDDLTIQEQFERFHGLNPWVFDSLVVLVTDWLAKGHRRAGTKQLLEVIRWEYGRQTEGDTFKINNNFTSRYARLLVERHPEWADVFETRSLRAA